MENIKEEEENVSYSESENLMKELETISQKSSNNQVSSDNKYKRNFQKRWFKLYCFIEKPNDGLPQCVLCGKSYSQNKVDRLKEHFEKIHSEFDYEYPLEDENSRIAKLYEIGEQLAIDPSYKYRKFKDFNLLKFYFNYFYFI